MRMYGKFAANAALLAVAGMALAQADKPLDLQPYNIQIRGGFYIPFDSTLRSVSDTFMGVGVDVILPEYIKGSTTFISGDWLFGTGGSSSNVFPICINEKFYGKPMGDKIPYWFIGAGLTILNVTLDDSVFGARGGVGLQIGPNVFVEGTFYWSDQGGGGDSNIGTGIYIGYRW